MSGIIDLPKFNYEDLEEIVAGEVTRFIWSLLVTQVVTYIRTTPTHEAPKGTKILPYYI